MIAPQPHPSADPERQEQLSQTANKDSEFYQKFIEGLAMFWVNLLIIVIFATMVFFFRDNDNWNGLDLESDWFDCFYFSFTTMTTIGYGDISPKSSLGKGICIIQQIIVLFQIANVLTKVVVEKPLKIRFRSLQRRRSESDFQSTPMDRIGRRRIHSCQLDYHYRASSTVDQSNSNNNTSIHHSPFLIRNGQSIEIEFPLPPNY